MRSEMDAPGARQNIAMAQPIPIHAAPQQMWSRQRQSLRNFYARPANNLDGHNVTLRNLKHSLTACIGAQLDAIYLGWIVLLTIASLAMVAGCARLKELK